MQWEREKKEIMDIEDLNCGQAPRSKNNEIFFVISGILLTGGQQSIIDNSLNPIHKPILQS